ncbi:hypothetical protein C8J57DRAFT_1541993 [Mycena rebaudengoi]|nr:hypothetical protein C8J57DRAFT_1541993 [Mycena rebaudengoi]
MVQESYHHVSILNHLFYLIAVGSGPKKRLLDALTAPALQHLTISEYELGSEPLSTITAFLSSNAGLFISPPLTSETIPADLSSNKGPVNNPSGGNQHRSLKIYLPDLELDTVPAHLAVKSAYNITCERGWRPIWEKEPANVKGVALWLWAKITKLRLDKIQGENNRHFVRKQKGKLLPTGGCHGDFYVHPEKWGATDQLIPVNIAVIDRLTEKYTPPDLFQFGTDEMVELCEGLYKDVGSPEVTISDFVEAVLSLTGSDGV